MIKLTQQKRTFYCISVVCETALCGGEKEKKIKILNIFILPCRCFKKDGPNNCAPYIVMPVVVMVRSAFLVRQQDESDSCIHVHLDTAFSQA